MNINEGDVLIRNNKQFLASELGEETVMMNMESGNVIGINIYGSSIWKLTEVPTTIEKITAHLISEYDVSEAECKKDVHEFVTTLLQKGILVTK